VGTWQRSDCRAPDNNCLGHLEDGTYASQYVEPRPVGPWRARFGAFSYTVPEGWANHADWPDWYGLTTAAEYDSVPAGECFECSGDKKTLALYVNPTAAATDCSEASEVGVGESPDEVIAFLTDHPGLTVGQQDATTVDGNPAIALDIEANASGPGLCSADGGVGVPIFYKEGSYRQTLPAGDAWHVILVDLGVGTVAIVADADPASLDAWTAETAPIVDSFQLPPPGDG
jgi:hypothetical protein